MYCESAAWGKAARALRHPPTLPESAVSVATRAERGGGRRMVKVKRQFQTWWEKHGWMDGCRYIYTGGWVKKGGGTVNGELGLFFQHHSSDRLTVGGKQQQQTPRGIFAVNGSPDHGHGSGV